MAEYDGISHYDRSGQMRLRDAEELLQPPTLFPQESGANRRHHIAACYLAGYSVECSLKMFLLIENQETSLSSLLSKWEREGRVVPNLIGKEGHQLNTLIGLTSLERLLDTETILKQEWGTCLRWKSTWRYTTQLPQGLEAHLFVTCCRKLQEWVKRHC